MRAELSSEHLALLRCGPLWVVSAVLGRARGFNQAELDAVWNSVIDTASGARGLPRDILGALAADRGTALAQLDASSLPVATALMRIVAVLGLVDPDTADEVKRAFLAVGRGVARARSLGRQMSEDDVKALLLVTMLLELPVDDADAARAGVALWT